MDDESIQYPQDTLSQMQGYYNPPPSENALKIRLETASTLEQIEMYLRGETWIVNSKGEFEKKPDGSAKANEKGIREIMRIVHSYINSPSVQGNLKDNQINMIMKDYHKGMGKVLGCYCEEWGINKNDRFGIVHFLAPPIFMFISRTKDNKERESFGMTIKQTGQQFYNDQKKGFSPFK